MSKWRWVPVEPEQEMLDAAYDAQGYQARQGMRAAWAAMLAAAPTPQPEAVAWPKVNGTARMFDNARALMVIMEREPTDDEMRAFDDAIKGWGTSPPAAPQPEAQPVAVVTECEACFTPDVCQLRGKCDHYSTDWLRVALAAEQPQPEAVSEWRMVPVEPTKAMLAAADKIMDCDPLWVARGYRAMIEAAPPPSAPERETKP